MKGVNKEIKVFSVLDELKKGNKRRSSSKNLKTVPERIGDRLDALEIKIEAILNRIK